MNLFLYVILVLLWMTRGPVSLKIFLIFNRFEVNKTPFERKERIVLVKFNDRIAKRNIRGRYSSVESEILVFEIRRCTI